MTKPALSHSPLGLRRREGEGVRLAGSKARAEHHSRNLFRAAMMAARTHSGAVPPRLVRLATERSRFRTSYTAAVIVGSMACISLSGSSAKVQFRASDRLTMAPV